MKRKIILAVCAATVAVLVAAPINNLFSKKVEAYTSYRQGMTVELLKNTDFKEGIEYPWCTVAMFPAEAETKVTDEGYKVTVNNIDDSTRNTRWGVTTRQRGIKIEAGNRYNVTFTVKADRDCKIYPTIREVGGN